MSVFRELVSHTSYYLSGQVLILATGLISMPIMTRLLTKEQYGMMSLVFLTVGWLGLVARLGLPQATTRFYAEYKKKGAKELQRFCTTILAGAVSASLVIVATVFCLSSLSDRYLAVSNFGVYLRIAATICLLRIIIAICKEIYRAEKRHFLYNAMSVSDSYGTLVCSILFLLLYRDVASVFIGTIVAEGIISLVFFIHLFLDEKIRPVRVSSEILLMAIRYGVPLVLSSSAAFILSSGDRYIIQVFLGVEAVANYSVVYDISERVGLFLFTPIRLAIVPLIFALWANDGPLQTSRFLSSTLRYISILFVPTLVGFSLVREAVITLLASAKYTEQSYLVPYVVCGTLLGSSNFLFAMGLTIQRKTTHLAWLTCIAGAVNIGLNLFLIPLYGLTGAALATVLASLILVVMTYQATAKILQIRLAWGLVGKSLLASLGMAALVLAIGDMTSNVFLNLLEKTIVGVVSYSVFVLMLDSTLRNDVLSVMKTRRFFFAST